MLSLIQEHLQAIYRTEAPDVRDFLIDDEQMRSLLGDEARPAEEWVLVRETDGDVQVAVYVATEHLAQLDGVGCPVRAADEIFRSFCVATEGVSHFMMLAERSRRAEPVTMLELEAQAEVDKFVCASLHHPTRSEEWWTRLFRDARLAEGLSDVESERYKEATRLAGAFCAHLVDVPHVDELLARMRAFWHASGAQRLDQMRRLAA